MQKVKIPLSVDPGRTAQQRLSYNGIFDGKFLPRITDVAGLVDNEVNVSLQFDTDEQNLVVISGSLNATLVLTCQRCNETYEVVVDSTFAFSPVRDDKDAEELPERYDAIVKNEDGEISIGQLLEDELILSIPLVPKHEPNVCGVKVSDMSWGVIEDEPKKQNPFEILKDLNKD